MTPFVWTPEGSNQKARVDGVKIGPGQENGAEIDDDQLRRLLNEDVALESGEPLPDSEETVEGNEPGSGDPETIESGGS